MINALEIFLRDAETALNWYKNVAAALSTILKVLVDSKNED